MMHLLELNENNTKGSMEKRRKSAQSESACRGLVWKVWSRGGRRGAVPLNVVTAPPVATATGPLTSSAALFVQALTGLISQAGAMRLKAEKPLSDVGRLAGLGPAQVGGLGQVRHVLLAHFADGLPPGLDAPHGRLDLPPADVVELGQVEQDADAAHREHEHQEDRLLRGPRHVALHLLHARVAVALEHPRHVEAVQEVLAGQEPDLQRVAEHHLDDVEAGDALLPTHLGALVRLGEPPGPVGDLLHVHVVVLLAGLRVHQDAVDVAGVQLAGVVVVMATVVAVAVVVHVGVEEGVAPVARLGGLVHRVGDEAQAGRAHQDDLEHPVADVRDGEGLVVAGLVAAGLHGVADEHDLLVLVHLLADYSHYQNTENHHHCQQDPAERQTERGQVGERERISYQ
ncbi:unnamed protein product [Menidia menidia]|uniref:(Atlantic silverside) hypothetical protein n=1 Tax=Menidia menidia TaxID=238744 RepID=A0A8S4AQT5_9TELE|nr:unnamed protein product [Menidia menidia]